MNPQLLHDRKFYEHEYQAWMAECLAKKDESMEAKSVEARTILRGGQGGGAPY